MVSDWGGKSRASRAEATSLRRDVDVVLRLRPCPLSTLTPPGHPLLSSFGPDTRNKAARIAFSPSQLDIDPALSP